jgi:serine/threonine-protein kinase
MTSTSTPFVVVKTLGAGATATVSLVTDRRSGRQHALKRLARRFVDEPAVVAAFLQEAALLAARPHPNIVRCDDAGTDDDGPYMLLEYVEGTTLRAWQRAGGGAVAPTVVARLGLELAAVLGALHEDPTGGLPMLHRDLSPSNLMVTTTGGLKLLDFGSARLLDGSTQTAGRHGAIGFSAPEVCRGGPAGAASDWFAAGMVLALLTAGRLPFESTSPAGTIRALARGEILPPTRWAAHLPAPLQGTLTALLDPEPTTRLADAAAVARALAPYAGGTAEVAAAFQDPARDDDAGTTAGTVTRTAPRRR